MDNRQRHYLSAVRLDRLHRPLLGLVLLMVVTGAVSLIGWFADDRILTGVPIWTKPLKFSISIGVYALTMAYLIPLLPRWRRTAWWAGTIIAATLVVEMIVIVGQVVRGRTSHFNVSTPFDAQLWIIMGASIAVMWVVASALAVLLARTPLGDRAMTRAIRYGLVLALAGMAFGFLMARQDTSELEGIAGAHAVGVADGGPGLPLLGWSTVGGDIRIPHFVGMHALQALPLLAFVLARLGARGGRLADESRRARLLLVASWAWAGVTAIVLWQALRGEPLVHPTAPTLVAAAVLVLAATGGAVVAMTTGSTAARRARAASDRLTPAA